MLKKLLLAFVLLVASAAAVVFFLFFTSATSFSEKSRYFYIPSDNATKAWVLKELKDSSITERTGIFNLVAERSGFWTEIKPGRYEIKQGINIVQMVRLLKNGAQSPVRLVINKFRTKEDMAKRLGLLFEPDSLQFIQFMNSPDSLGTLGLDTNTAMTLVIPNTYSVFWNTGANKLYRKLFSESESFWNSDRLAKASKLGLTKEQAYILASIVEEESNKNDEKPVIASVYLNRLKKNMRLSADPTVKFALRDFGIKRIRFKHINESAGSPYNTYRNSGLPPGPICTPSIKTIDAVLDAAETDYLFFCARPDFSGYHAFASNEKDHFKNAIAYQKALDSLLLK